MGFYPDLRKLIRAVPPADRRQTMLFSATLNAYIKNLAWEYTRNPFEIAIEPETVTVEEVEQILYHVSSVDKMKLLLGILKREEPESVLIFCNTKRYAEITAKRLRHNGFECEFIMGDLPQPKRLKIIDDIKAGKLHILVATDVAARGLDIEDLALVVNYDLPNESENYVHRIGRTARMGKTGKAITLASEQDVYQLPAIERYIGQKIPSETVTEELFSEDMSEGKRIHTDFYEERGRRDEGRSRSRRKDREGQDGRERERGKRRHEKARPGGSSTSPQGVGSESRVSRVRRGGSSRRGQDGQGFLSGKDAALEHGEHAVKSSDVKLSELSLEERMAYYKEKYDKGGGTPGAGRGGQKREKTGGKTQHKGQKQPRQGRSRSAAGADRSRADSRASPQKPAASPAPAVEQTAVKKGMLSRLLGIFKKK